MEEEFKQTEIGRIPKEWEVVRLGDIANITTGKSNVQDAKEKGAYLFFDRSGMVKRSDRYLFEKEAVIIPGEGKEFLPKYYNGKFDLHQRAYAIFDFYERLYGKYLFYLMYRVNKLLLKWAVGTTVKSLRLPMFKNLPIPLPPLPEQKKIAEILSTVDEAIEKVDEAIAKTDRLKKGLMHELLTKGIGHKEFRDSEIGRIPKGWEVVKIKDIGEVFTGKTPATSKNIYWNGEIPFITPEDMTGEKYVYKTNRHVTFEGANQSGKILPPNAVLVVCIGSTVGKVALTYRESVTNQQINSILCKEKVYCDYVYYAISHRSFMLKNYSGVAAVPIVKKSLFEEFRIPLPRELREQQKIAGILSTVDKRLELLRNRKERLRRIKKGLMDELLTGKKRVKVRYEA